MSQLARQVKAYFDDKKLNYETRTGENEETLIRAGFEMKNSPAVSIIMVFPKDEQACKLFAYDIIQFKAARRSEEYKFCNEVNVRYRWVKFYAEEQADNNRSNMLTVSLLLACKSESKTCHRIRKSPPNPITL